MKKTFTTFLIIVLITSLSGCIRTSEDIRLDKEFRELKTNVDLNNQKLNTKIDTQIASVRQNQVDMLSKLDSTKNDIQDLRNRMDILEHRFNKLSREFNVFAATGLSNTDTEQRLSALETSMTAVEAWMSLSTVSSRALTHHTESTIKPRVLTLDNAVRLFKAKKFEQAKPVFEKYSKKGNTLEKERSFFYLGEIAYNTKDYKTAIANYGIIVEKYPKSSLITDTYYMIGKSFVKIGSKDKAKLFFEELISKYPNDRLSKEARKELKKLKN
ncbi:MAG: tetratricopeptide repeat protein [Deltaproteobacteria bacterium]|nr:tetratricopeptide repeat protein [Deltaproteobacteria bacterium]MCL5792878.1 tetratricopeptide repeat protein [Deltaproteobacteria bacterium]